jgi:hypothetical protein
MNKKGIQVELVEMASASPGVYTVRPFAGADSPDNLDRMYRLDRSDWTRIRCLHWIPDHPDRWEVDADKYRDFVSKCLSNSPERLKASCEDANLLALKDAEGVRKEAADETCSWTRAAEALLCTQLRM